MSEENESCWDNGAKTRQARAKSRIDEILKDISRLSKEAKSLETELDNPEYFRDSILSTVEELYDIQLYVE